MENIILLNICLEFVWNTKDFSNEKNKIFH